MSVIRDATSVIAVYISVTLTAKLELGAAKSVFVVDFFITAIFLLRKLKFALVLQTYLTELQTAKLELGAAMLELGAATSVIAVDRLVLVVDFLNQQVSSPLKAVECKMQTNLRIPFSRICLFGRKSICILPHASPPLPEVRAV